MSLRGLTDVLAEAPAYRRVAESIAPGENPAATAPEAAKPMVIASLWRDLQRPLLVVCPHPDDARRLVEQLGAYCSEETPLLHFAEAEVLPYERLSVEAGTVQERMRALGALRGSSGSPPLIVVVRYGLCYRRRSPPTGCGRVPARSPGASRWRWRRRFSIGRRLATAWGRWWIIRVRRPGAGASWMSTGRGTTIRCASTCGGTRSIRSACSIPTPNAPGSIWTLLRCCPPLKCSPRWRTRRTSTNWCGASTSAIRTRPSVTAVQDELANLVSGISFDNATLYAGFLLRHTLLDHLPKDAVVVINEPFEVEEAARHVEGRTEQLRLAKEERGDLPMGFPSALADWDAIAMAIADVPRRLELSRYHRAETGGQAVALPFDAAPSYHGAIEGLADAARGGRLGAVVIATQHSQRLRELLADAEVGAAEMRSLDGRPGDGVAIVHTTVAGGWSLAGEDGGFPSVTLLSDAEVFGTRKQRVTRPRRHSQRFRATTVEELTPGEYVVHVDHGIGRFAGTMTKSDGDGTEEGGAREYLVLEYAGDDRLYVPMEHLARLSPYVGGSETPPSPTRLGYAGVDAHGDAGSRVDAEAGGRSAGAVRAAGVRRGLSARP